MKLCRAVFCLTSALLSASAYHAKTKGSQRDFSITIPSECIGKELCLEKPIDYPSEEIDIVARRLPKRLKRHNEEFDRSSSADSENYSNNCAIAHEMIQPFLMIQNVTAHFVIQSGDFSQKIQSTFCKSAGATCLEDFTLPNYIAKCKTAFTLVRLTTYDHKDGTVNTVEVEYPVDCQCSVMIRQD